MNQKNLFRACPVCGSRHLHYSFSISSHRVVQCQDCDLMLINPQPSDEVLASIYGGDYFVLSDTERGRAHVSNLKQSTADRYLDILLSKHDSEALSKKTILEIGCGGGDFLLRAATRGLNVVGVEYSSFACTTAREKLKDFSAEIIQGELSKINTSVNSDRFDFIVFCDVLEHVRDPVEFLKIVRNLLAPEGLILCVVPSLDSWSAKLLKANWMEFKLEHLFYFNTKNLRSLLFQSGFSEMTHFPAKKTLSLDYISAHFEKHGIPFWSFLINLGHKFIPAKIANKGFPITASGIGMISKKKIDDGLKISVVLPAFNEEKTIQNVIDGILKKELNGLKLELIIVESNSTDLTRKIVNSYSERPRVKIILQEKALGKGNAVRAGLKAATGDFILIQDADAEYDLDDYDALIEPLRNGSEAFVLGARHGGGGWKIRKFADQPFRAFLLNCGHWFFTLLINIMYGVWLRDPFTMYKVFRRDAIQNISFECNKFDFDHELVIKLIRKGFRPIEIPVNYRSRSFLEGKKVSIFSDPITWIIAIFKYRFSKL